MAQIDLELTRRALLERRIQRQPLAVAGLVNGIDEIGVFIKLADRIELT